MSNCFNPANILLPKENTDMEKWSVIACDQFTSQADYWNAVEKYVGDAPSTLNVVFPEIYLGNDKRITCINSTMEKYLSDGTLQQAVTDGYVLVERTTESGARLGIVGLVDLEDYDFDPKNPTLIRATEGTVISRIPPRVKIRENAAIELPHVMLLVDDPVDEADDACDNGKLTGADNIENSMQKSVDNIGNVEHGIIEFVYSLKDSFRKLYDTDLMQDGGHIRGYAIEGEAAKQVTAAFTKKQEQCGGFLFAVGDGNHSLATAKTCWENIKKSGKYTDEQLKTHPARYALVEICNLHSKALEFKPIHRLLTKVNVEDMLAFFKEQLKEQGLECAEGNEIVFEYVDPDNGIDKNTYAINITNRGDRLPVEILQGILDKYLELHEETEIDYIHGDDALHRLVKETKGCGIFLQSIDKSTLFPAINAGGVLPRKTFSIGEANEKRYYMECHDIQVK